MSLFIVDVSDEVSIKLSDPLSGIYNNFKREIDYRRDFSKGVWIGTQPINDFIRLKTDSFLLGLVSLNIAHYAVRINGLTFSLTTDGINCVFK